MHVRLLTCPHTLRGAAEGALVPNFAVRAWRVLVLAGVLVHGFFVVVVDCAEVLGRTHVTLVHYLSMHAGIAPHTVALNFATGAEVCRLAQLTLLLPNLVFALDGADEVARRTLTPATAVTTLGSSRTLRARVPSALMLASILSFVLWTTDLGQDAD